MSAWQIPLSGPRPQGNAFDYAMKGSQDASNAQALMGQQQLRQEQIANAQLENQKAQVLNQQMLEAQRDDQTKQRLFNQAGGDIDTYLNLLKGQVKPDTYLAEQAGITKARQGLQQLQQGDIDTLNAQYGMIGREANAIIQTPDENKADAWAGARARLSKAGIPAAQLPQEYPGDEWARQHLNLANAVQSETQRATIANNLPKDIQGYKDTINQGLMNVKSQDDLDNFRSTMNAAAAQALRIAPNLGYDPRALVKAMIPDEYSDTVPTNARNAVIGPMNVTKLQGEKLEVAAQGLSNASDMADYTRRLNNVDPEVRGNFPTQQNPGETWADFMKRVAKGGMTAYQGAYSTSLGMYRDQRSQQMGLGLAARQMGVATNFDEAAQIKAAQPSAIAAAIPDPEQGEDFGAYMKRVRALGETPYQAGRAQGGSGAPVATPTESARIESKKTDRLARIETDSRKRLDNGDDPKSVAADALAQKQQVQDAYEAEIRAAGGTPQHYDYKTNKTTPAPSPEAAPPPQRNAAPATAQKSTEADVRAYARAHGYDKAKEDQFVDYARQQGRIQ
jgi:hypothetical protein